MAIKSSDLVSKFQYALDNKWGYIMYMSHEMWSESKQAEYNRKYAHDPDCDMSREYGSKWYGHWVTDCSGLFKWAFAELGGKIAHGSNSIWDRYCVSQGDLANGQRTDGQKLKPGTAVFTTNKGRHNHIGLYIGNETVIEAQGTQAGVITSSVSNKKWSAWGELKNVSYSGDEREDIKMKAKVVLPSGASGSTVNMREQPKKTAEIIRKVPVGSIVEVIIDQGEWCRIEYNGEMGWMMSNYLEYDGQGGEDSGEDISPEQKEQIENALKAIEAAVDIIGNIIGRG